MDLCTAVSIVHISPQEELHPYHSCIMPNPQGFHCRADSSSSVGSGSGSQGLGHFLDAFDKAWAAYLQRFVAWKFADAAALESELIKVAIEMEASVLSKTGGDTSPDTERSEDLQVSIFGHLVVPHLVSTM